MPELTSWNIRLLRSYGVPEHTIEGVISDLLLDRVTGMERFAPLYQRAARIQEERRVRAREAEARYRLRKRFLPEYRDPDRDARARELNHRCVIAYRERQQALPRDEAQQAYLRELNRRRVQRWRARRRAALAARRTVPPQENTGSVSPPSDPTRSW